MGQTPKDMALVQDEINKITKKKINATVKINLIAFAAWDQQINLMFSGNEKLDLLPVMYYNFGPYVQKGALLPIDDLLSKYGAGIKKAIDPDYFKVGQSNGKTYGVVGLRADLASAHSPVMRKDLIDKYKIDITKIKKIADLTEVFKTIKANEPSIIPLVTQAAGAGNSVISPYKPYDPLNDELGVLLNGGQSDTKVVDWYESDQYANLVKLTRSWFQAGYISKDVATSTDSGATIVKANKAFAYLSPWKYGLENQDTKSCGTKMVTAPFDDKPFLRSASVQFLQWTLPSNCQNPEKTMQFLNLMYSDSNIQNLLQWGIEGKHYAKVSGEDNVIDYPQGVTAANSGYGLNLGWALGNQMIGYVWKGDAADLYKKSDAFNKSAVKSKAFGFVFDESPVKTEVASVTNVVKQYRTPIEDGAVEPSTELPKFIAALKAAGINKIISEKQSQLDKWLAKQK
jgi:putative aldouronate transport system substrate-binding protein